MLYEGVKQIYRPIGRTGRKTGRYSEILDICKFWISNRMETDVLPYQNFFRVSNNFFESYIIEKQHFWAFLPENAGFQAKSRFFLHSGGAGSTGNRISYLCRLFLIMVIPQFGAIKDPLRTDFQIRHQKFTHVSYFC